MSARWRLAGPFRFSGLMLLACVPSVRAQGVVPAGVRLSPADSLAVLELARATLVDHHFRVLTGPPPGQRMSGPSRGAPLTSYAPAQMEGNAQRAAAHRPDLIETLDEFARRLPGDDFILGQRVGQRFLAGRIEEALGIARDCGASSWWCAALEGFLLHEGGAFIEAEEAFTRALRGMPPNVRCPWEAALVPLLAADLATAYSAEPCGGRTSLERRIWWLADPFYLVPGNDRRTEHLGRLVAWEMMYTQWVLVGQWPHWGDPSTAYVAQGFDEWWWGVEGPPPNEASGDLPGYAFLPSASAGEAPGGSISAEWELRLEDRDVFQGGRERLGVGYDVPAFAAWDRALWDDRYLPAYPVFRELPDQTAFFLRGDSFAVAAAVDVDRHPLAVRQPIRVGAVLARHENDLPTIVWGTPTGTRYLMRAMIPAEPHLVSVEGIGADGGAARVRFGHSLAARTEGQVGLSDLLLFDWEDGIVEELEAVAPRMLGMPEIGPDREVGVFWEMYPLEGSVAAEFSLTIVPEDVGILRRLGGFLRLVDRPGSRGLRWSGEVEGEVVGRVLQIDLAGLPPGRYTLELAVVTGSQEVRARRVFERPEAGDP